MATVKVQSHECMAAGMKLVRTTSNLGRKRIMIFEPSDSFDPNCELDCPLQRQDSKRLHIERSKNRIESLPLDILVRVLCKVDHSDLQHLLLVSKFLNEGVSIARKMHFAFSTPHSKPVFKILTDIEEYDSVDAPNAPRQQRVRRSRLEAGKLSRIVVALFASLDDE